MSYKSWDSIDRNIIVGVSLEVAKMSETDLRAVVFEQIEPQFNADGDEVFSGIVALEKIELLGVPGGAVLATLGNYLQRADRLFESGFAKITEVNGKKIPLIVMHGACDDESILKHEKIHLCQFLNPDRWPTAADMAEIAGADLQIPADGEALLSMAADICQALITELEAYRFSEELAEETSVCDRILKGTGASASPFIRADDLISLHFNGAFEYLEYLESLIKRFCDHVTETQPWVKCLVRNSSFSSLREALAIQAAESCKDSMESYESTVTTEPCPECGSENTEDCGDVTECDNNVMLGRCKECLTLFCLGCGAPVGDEGPVASFPEVCPVCGSENIDCRTGQYKDSDGKFPSCHNEIHCSDCGKTCCAVCGAVSRG